jgi:hypothetical protein
MYTSINERKDGKSEDFNGINTNNRTIHPKIIGKVLNR